MSVIINKRNNFLLNILTIFLSVFICILTVEVAYRIKIFYLSDKPIYQILSRSIYDYSEQYGFNYTPNSNATLAGIQNGRVCYYHYGSVNEEGNIGVYNPSWSPDDFKILIVGDSFSANPFGPDGPITWTDYFPKFLSEFYGRSVSVKNYARDCYGIIQMFHLALGMAKKYKPDLIVVAFITDDLIRSRFYRSTNTYNGVERVLTSPNIGNPPDILYSIDTVFINPKVSELIQKDNRETLSEIESQCDKIVRQYRRYFWTINRSYLYDRIVHKDKFYSLTSRVAKIEYSDYSNDPLFREDVMGIRELNIPLYIVHIPIMEEINAGMYLLKPQHESLIKSLEHITGTKTTRLLPLSEQPKNIEEMFLLPYDMHPNKQGAVFYAKLVAESIIKNRVNLTQPAFKN